MCPIIVGVDPAARRETHEALAMGEVLAAALGSPMQAVHVYMPRREDGLAQRRAHERHLIRVLDEAHVAAAVTAFPGTSPARVLHYLADRERAECMVIASGRDARPGRTFLGAVGEALLHGSRVPVVVTPRGYRAPTGGLERIAVAYGGTPESDEALRVAADLADGAAITVLAAGDPAPGAPTATAQERIDHALATTTVPADGSLVEGDAADGLAAYSADVDLLVAGSRSYGPLRVVLLGAVTRRLLAEARSPVMIVPRLPDAAHEVALVGGMEVALNG